MRKRRAESFLHTHEVTRSGDKVRHIFSFDYSVHFKYFDIREYVSCDGFAKTGKKGEEVVWGISFKGTHSQRLRVERALVRNGISFSIISSSKSPLFAKVWREHSCMHGLLKDLINQEQAQQALEVA